MQLAIVVAKDDSALTCPCLSAVVPTNSSQQNLEINNILPLMSCTVFPKQIECED